MRICQPDSRGRINLGDLVSQGDTWGIESGTEDRIQLVRMKPIGKQRKGSLLDYCSQLRDLGFTLPERDQSPIQTSPLE